MAEAFLRDMAGDRFEVMSAGAEATTLDPEAVAAMDEVGLDISRQTPKKAPVRFSPAQFGGCNGRLKNQLPREAAKNAAR
jgi:hypothetical protein